jgi:hypothetical protein
LPQRVTRSKSSSVASRAPKASAPAAAAAGPTAPAAAPGTGTGTTPAPTSPLRATMTTLPKGQLLERVHPDRFGATEFNPGTVGNARFSPIRDDKGVLIPTLYAGTTLACALMESVFHDVPYTAGLKTFDKAKLTGQVHSTIETRSDLTLVDLTTVALRRLGVTRPQLIETEKDRYPQTRLWAEALHREFPDAQGLTWVSRQDDTARACIIFGDRIPASALQQQGVSRGLVGDPAAYGEVLDLADRLDVAIVPGKV